MISCPEVEASIRGVKPDPGSLLVKKKPCVFRKKKTTGSHDFGHQPSLSLDVCVCVVIQQELDHLLVAGARAMEQGRPSSAVLTLQLSTLLQSGQKSRLETEVGGAISKKVTPGVVPEAGSRRCFHCRSWRPASGESTLWPWLRSH